MSPLGENVLLFRAMRTTEQLGRLFEYELDVLSDDAAIKLADLLGQNVTVGMALPDDEFRYFNGIVSRFAQVGAVGDRAWYHITLRPWLWFLTRTADCRIFQSMTVPDIIKQIFSEYGLSDIDDQLQGTYREWVYCVQYRETDYNFISRLMEQEGIYFFFRHEAGKHTLVLADSYSAHTLIPEEEVAFHQPTNSAAIMPDTIQEWYLSQEVQPGRYELTDYNFETPNADLRVKKAGPLGHAADDLEIYDYPGEYDVTGDGDTYIKARLEELQAQFEQVRGSGNVAGVYVGGLVKMIEHPRDDQNREYLFTAVSHEMRSNLYESGGDGRTSYSCSFTAIPSGQQYRTPRLTPKPLIQGPQTAVVVGPSDEEIYTDKYGRVKVQFHWDREGKRDENSSCWIRVAQVWAGGQWGAMHIPRMGQEVIVEFLEGDPDRPIITGRVYNDAQMPPYGLPDNMTQSGIKSRSTKGGGGANFNEMRFEDKKGSEQLYMHAEKDWTVHVKNAEAETVGASISTNAGGSISRSAGADHSRTADKNIADKAGVNITTNSGKNMVLQAGGSYSLHTNLGIQLKAMNFIAALIESGAKDAAKAIQKGAAGTAVAAGAAGAGGGGASGAGSQLASGGEQTGMKALAALGPGIEAGTAELGRMSDAASKGVQKLDGPVNKAIGKMDAVKNALQSGAGPEVVAAAVMAMAAAAVEAWEDAAKIVEEMFPQIPSITMWAMKDISARALWSMSLTTYVKNITIHAENKDVNIKAKKSLNLEASDKDFNLKAKQHVNIEASDKNLSIKAGKKDILITAKEKVSIKSEDKDFIIEAGKTKVTVKAAKQIALVCGSASICLKEGGDILIKGGKITLKGTEALTAKGNPIKLN